MRSHSKAPPSQFEVRIEKLVYGGSGLGRHEGLVVFVPFTAPGDLVKVRATERKKNFVRASAIEILEPGPGRQEAPCAHFGSCGGCQWQHLEYGHQLEFKRMILEEVFHHNLPETRSLKIEMMRSPETLGYRSQARVQARGIGANAVVGFYESQTHRVEDIESCPLFHPALNKALAAVRGARRRESLDSGVHELELACSPEEAGWRCPSVQAAEDPSPGSSAADGGTDAEETILQRRIGEFTYQ